MFPFYKGMLHSNIEVFPKKEQRMHDGFSSRDSYLLFLHYSFNGWRIHTSVDHNRQNVNILFDLEKHRKNLEAELCQELC